MCGAHPLVNQRLAALAQARCACRARPAARLHSPASGRALDLYTNAPGLNLYTGNYLDGTQVRAHRCRRSFCSLEACTVHGQSHSTDSIGSGQLTCA